MSSEHFSIGDLERISGIKAHTIRVWEQRYKALSPDRSDGGTRYYSETDMMRVMILAFLSKRGMRISKIASLSLSELRVLAEIDQVSDQTFDEMKEQLMIHSLEYNQLKLVELIDGAILNYGIETTFTQIIFPFLRMVGIFWLTGKITPGHEHFFSNICRQKLFSEIDKLPQPAGQRSHVVLLQPPWDFHEMGILYYNYIIRKNGFSTTYLGQAVPAKDAIETIHATKASWCIATFIAPTSEEKIIEFVLPVIEQSPNTHFLLTGPHLTFNFNQHSDRITIFRSIDELKKILQMNEASL
jgi:MerR family transcriptional regulator, light-induced transcriptional regulator